MKRCAIYVRVSSIEQGTDQHVSLQVQEDRCRAYVAQHGWSLVTVETDMESGLTSKRAAYQRIVQLARDNSIDVIVVAAASRFGRKASEVLIRTEELRELGVDVVSTSEDLTSFLMLGIQAVLNEEESRRLSARVAPAKRLKASQGYWLGHAPFGTINTKGSLSAGPHFDLVRLAFELAADGVAMREIARRLNASLAPRMIHLSTVKKMLRNPAYIGRVHWDGLEADGRWDPLIDMDLFERAGAKLTRRYQERAPLSMLYPFWIVGLAFCGQCGSRMHPKIHVKKWGTQYAYLVCGRQNHVTATRGCHGAHYLIDPIQHWALGEISAVSMDGDVDDFMRWIERRLSEGDDAHSERRATLQTERARLVARIQKAKSGYLDGALDAADVKQVELTVRDTIAAIDSEMAHSVAPARAIDTADVRRFFSDRRWLELADSDPAAFRDMLRMYVQRVVVSGRGSYSIEWAPALRALIPTSTQK